MKIACLITKTFNLAKEKQKKGLNLTEWEILKDLLEWRVWIRPGMIRVEIAIRFAIDAFVAFGELIWVDCTEEVSSVIWIVIRDFLQNYSMNGIWDALSSKTLSLEWDKWRCHGSRHTWFGQCVGFWTSAALLIGGRRPSKLLNVLTQKWFDSKPFPSS